jgi:hypothetical protein
MTAPLLFPLYVATVVAAPASDSTRRAEIRVLTGPTSAASPILGHLGRMPTALYLDPPGGMASPADVRLEASRNGNDFYPLTLAATPATGRWSIAGELSDRTTCYRMRWTDANGETHTSGILLARRCSGGIVDAVCAAPFTQGESIGLEIALRQRAHVRVILTEMATGRPQLLFRGMADEGVGHWSLGRGAEIRPGIWEVTVAVNGTEHMRFEIEI